MKLNNPDAPTANLWIDAKKYPPPRNKRFLAAVPYLEEAHLGYISDHEDCLLLEDATCQFGADMTHLIY